MTTLTIGNGGEITLPSELLEHMRMPHGGYVEVTLRPDGELEFRKVAEALKAKPSSRQRPGRPE
jgi:hypothetical protein